MKGWGCQDDFQEQINATEKDGVARARAELEGEGSDHCEDCGELIDPRRKKAVPNAKRCINHQMLHEMRNG